jgi:amino acid transporter
MQDGQGQPAPSFVRSLGVTGVLFLTLSVTTPASSVFVFIPDMIAIAGTGAIWAFLIAAIVCVATAFIYAELSSAWPVAGGNMSWLRTRRAVCGLRDAGASTRSTT